jgi:hypothetical protein
MDETFGSTCHGAGRAQVPSSLFSSSPHPQSRSKSRRILSYQDVLDKLKEQVRNRLPPSLLSDSLSPGTGNRHPCRLSEARDGRGSRVVQRRHCCGGHLPRGGDLEEGSETQAHRCDQRVGKDRQTGTRKVIETSDEHAGHEREEGGRGGKEGGEGRREGGEGRRNRGLL